VSAFSSLIRYLESSLFGHNCVVILSCCCYLQ